MGVGRRLALVGVALCGGACDRGAPSAAGGDTAQQVAPAIAQTGWVTDNARIIADDQERVLAATLSRFRQRTQHQLVIVTVAALGGRSVDQYAHNLFNAWRLGRRGVNDGIMLLVAPNERRVRIQVGFGLERELTNARCAEIIRTMIPSFKRENYGQGIERGTDAIVADLDPAQPSSSSSS